MHAKSVALNRSTLDHREDTLSQRVLSDFPQFSSRKSLFEVGGGQVPCATVLLLILRSLCALQMPLDRVLVGYLVYSLRWQFQPNRLHLRRAHPRQTSYTKRTSRLLSLASSFVRSKHLRQRTVLERGTPWGTPTSDASARNNLGCGRPSRHRSR